MYYFEDFQVGQVYDLGTITLSEEAIIAFAREYDPQPFHLSAEGAKDSPFGGIIASGWQTIALFMRRFVDVILNNAVSLASPGVDEVRFRKPIRPGETLTARCTVTQVTPSRSRPEMGVVHFRDELVNPAGEVVLSLLATHFLGRKPSE